MRRTLFDGALLFFAIAVSCQADLTLRYTTTVKMGAGLPGPLTDALAQTAGAPAKDAFIRIKGDVSLSDAGALTIIIDNGAKQVTLLRPATREYARVPMADYLSSIAASVPPPTGAAATAFKNMKFDVQSNPTGKVDTISGMRAQENLMTISVSLSLPAGVPTGLPGAAASASPTVRVELHTWTASPEEINRVPALREYAAYSQGALNVFDASEWAHTILSMFPGLGEKMRESMETLAKNGNNLTLRTQQKLYMPAMAALVNRPQADGLNPPQAAGPDEPTMETDQNLVEISTAPIDAAVFEAPADFRTASIAELLQPAKPAPAAAKAPPAPDLAPGEPVFRVGGGVTPPSIASKVDPAYSEEARKAGLSGSVLVSAIIDKEGIPRNIEVLKPLGMGLDDKAVAAVTQWRFKPGQKDGNPVNVRATIEINFKMLKRPPQQ